MENIALVMNLGQDWAIPEREPRTEYYKEAVL